MSDIGVRINTIRKTLELTMEEFGKKIGITRSSVNSLEKGVNNPSEQTLKLICREFNVDYFWLTEGIGDEMFIKKETDPIKLIAKQHGLTDLEAEIVVEFIKLQPEEREAMIKIIGKLFKNK